MAERTMADDEKILQRATWGGLVGLAILLVSAGAADEGFRRVLGVVVGLLVLAAAFTRLPAALAARMTQRTGARLIRLSALWISISSVIVPLLVAFILAPALLAGVPVNSTFAALIIGPAIGALLNLVVVVINLFDLRAA